MHRIALMKLQSSQFTHCIVVIIVGSTAWATHLRKRGIKAKYKCCHNSFCLDIVSTQYYINTPKGSTTYKLHISFFIAQEQ